MSAIELNLRPYAMIDQELVSSGVLFESDLCKWGHQCVWTPNKRANLSPGTDGLRLRDVIVVRRDGKGFGFVSVRLNNMVFLGDSACLRRLEALGGYSLERLHSEHPEVLESLRLHLYRPSA